MGSMGAAGALLEPRERREPPPQDDLPLVEETHCLVMQDNREHRIEVLSDIEAMRQFAEHLGILYPLNELSFRGKGALRIVRIKDGVQIFPQLRH